MALNLSTPFNAFQHSFFVRTAHSRGILRFFVGVGRPPVSIRIECKSIGSKFERNRFTPMFIVCADAHIKALNERFKNQSGTKLKRGMECEAWILKRSLSATTE